jgi:replication factor A1
VYKVGITPEEHLKVSGLKHDLRNVNLTVKIVNIGPSRTVPSKRGRRQHLVAEALVGDETGSVVLTLWDDQIGMFEPGDVIKIGGGYTTLFKGSLRLNIGRGGRAEKVDKEIAEVNTRNNLSEKTHIQVPWYRSEGRPFRRRRRR